MLLERVYVVDVRSQRHPYLEYALAETRKLRLPRKKSKLHEGDEAREKFERTMKALFQVPKANSKTPKKGKD